MVTGELKAQVDAIWVVNANAERPAAG